LLALNALADWEKLWQKTVSPSKCCVLSISVGKDSSVVTSPYLNIRDNQLPVVNSTLDLGITVTHDLTPCMHIKTLLLKLICVQMPYIAVLFLRTTCPYVHFLSMSPLLEHNSVVWSPYLKQDIIIIRTSVKTVYKKVKWS